MAIEPTSSPERSWKLHGRRWLDYRRKRFWAVVVVLLYVLAGFFVVPPIVRGQIVSSLQKSLDRPVALDRVSFNPLLLSVDLRGLQISEKDKSPLLGFDRLHIRLSPASLWQWAWSFGEISLEGFKGELIRYEKGDTNIERLIQAVQAPAGAAKPDKAPASPRLIIRHLSIQNATATFTDRMRATPFTTKIGPVTGQIDSFSTLPDKTGKQHLVVDFEQGATLEWTSQSSLVPLSSSGHVTAKGPYVPLIARYIGDTLKLSMPAGTVEAELDYRLQQRPGGDLGLAVDHLGLVLKTLAVREANAAAPFVTLPEFRLAGGHMAWPERQAGADSLTIEGLSIALRRQSDGTFAPMPVPAAAQASPQPSPQPAPQEGPGWSISLGKLDVKKAKAQIEDKTLREGGKIEIASLDLSAQSLSNKPGDAFPFSATAALAPSGTVKLEGKVSVLPSLAMDAKANFTGLPVVAIQPYLHDFARLTIESGTLDGEGDVKMAQPEGLRVSGKGEVRSMKLTDEVEKRPVVAWDHLSIDHYSYHQDANELQISQVTLTGPYVRFQVAKDQSNNFGHVFVQAGPAAQGGGAPAKPGGTAAPMKISIGNIAVAEGSADYGDASLPLPFATHITRMKGRVAALVSSSASASGVALEGQVDQYGQVKIFGKVNPFQVSKGMKINVVFTNVDFPGLSPYSVKFAGRRIAKGKLDVQSQYSIDGGKLSGSNKVVIRDMELGEKVDSPGAKDLPLDLAISLLKDDEGRINLDLPVTGNVNDPQFDFGTVISDAIFNVLTDIVTAPFRALAGLFGGGGQALDHIDFAPGRATLEPPEQEKIRHLGDILQKRPELGVVVPGVLDKEADRTRLQRDAFDAEMAKELGDHATVDRQRKFMESLAEKRLGADKVKAVQQQVGQSGDDPGYMAELRHQVAKTEPVDDGVLAALAQSRADAVVGALKQIPGLDQKHVVQRGTKDVKADDDHVPLQLQAATSDKM